MRNTARDVRLVAATVCLVLVACTADTGDVEHADTTTTSKVEPRTSDPPPSPTTAPPPPSGPAFDRGAAIAALGAVNVQTSKKVGGPTGAGRVTVTFINNGTVSDAFVGPPYAGTSVGACVMSKYRAITVPPFGGYPVTVSKSFTIT
jgi:hypothetical protein